MAASTFLMYRASKTLAEKGTSVARDWCAPARFHDRERPVHMVHMTAAWELYEKNRPSMPWDLVVL